MLFFRHISLLCLLLLLVSPGCTLPLPSENSDGYYNKHGDFVCRKNVRPAPITINELKNALAKSGITVFTTNDSNCDDPEVGFRIQLSNELSNVVHDGPSSNYRNEEMIIARQGLVLCTITAHPLYQEEGGRIVPENYKDLSGYGYKNAGCDVSGLGERATETQIETLRDVFVRLKQADNE
jgi:hypothetical protein